MLRSIPPHLILLISLLTIVIWVMLLHYFRRSDAVQKFVAQTLGDDTPENALLAFEIAKRRLADHLNDADLNRELRRRIESLLGSPHTEDATYSQRDDRSF